MAKNTFLAVFILGSLAAHVVFFSSVRVQRPSLPVARTPMRVSYRILESSDVLSVASAGGKRVFEKVLGPVDRLFYGYPSENGFSRRFMKPRAAGHTLSAAAGRTPQRRPACAGVSAEPERSVPLPDANARALARRRSIAHLITPAAVGAPQPLPEGDKDAAARFALEGPLSSRDIAARVVPAGSAGRRTLDMTADGAAGEGNSTIRVKILVDRQGAVRFALLERGCGTRKLDDLYLRAIRGWRFAPDAGNAPFDSGTVTVFLR